MAGKRGRPQKYFTAEEKKAARKRIDGKYYRTKGKAQRQRKKEERAKQMQLLEARIVSSSTDLISTDTSVVSNLTHTSSPPASPAALSSSLPPSSPPQLSSSSLQLSSSLESGPSRRTVLKPIRRGDKRPVKRARSPSPNQSCYPIQFFGPTSSRKRSKFVICDSDSEDNTLPMASSVENSPH